MIGFHGDACMENEPYSTLRVHEQTHAGPVSGPCDGCRVAQDWMCDLLSFLLFTILIDVSLSAFHFVLARLLTVQTLWGHSFVLKLFSCFPL